MEDRSTIPSVSTGRLTARQRWMFAGLGVILVAGLIGMIGTVVALLRQPDQTQTIRDIVIIFLAVESWFLGLALILLMIQLARLAALLQNEVRPILDSTNETLGTLKGTTVFLSRNLVRPVIRINSSVSALRKALDMLRTGRSD